MFNYKKKVRNVILPGDHDENSWTGSDGLLLKENGEWKAVHEISDGKILFQGSSRLFKEEEVNKEKLSPTTRQVLSFSQRLVEMSEGVGRIFVYFSKKGFTMKKV